MQGKKEEPGGRRYRTDWDPLAAWYDGWVGESGSKHHRFLAIPAVMELLELVPGERVLDIGSGQGVMCPVIVEAGGEYTGVDLSKSLVQIARRYGNKGVFLTADAMDLAANSSLPYPTFDAAVFLLSLQDMDPLSGAVRSAGRVLRDGGKLVILLTHPCFRIPRQSGWGWDENRKLRFRRIDSYLSRLDVPLKLYPGKMEGITRSFHRPLEDYFSALTDHQFVIDRLVEIPTYKEERTGDQARAINRSNKEIPLFLGLRARKLPLVEN